ncbi:alpha/beta-hydrolase [Ascobolus immersus RN42]|uniref:Alpha/beta-hydrolase n=1 Tax=Ascobolus immersus RN42 TaxID=1160509 RepID=A0A3N4I7H2_ASCIM|nr:alpha/beta-hydrolase [Ascobolus immersus RN42]
MANDTKPRGILILLHGRGDNSNGFRRGITELADQLPSIGFELVLPTSDIRHSLVFGKPISEWFDIASLKDTDEEQETQLLGLHESIEQVLTLIEEQVAKVDGDYKRIYLGGISQGMAVASLVLLLLGQHKLGGFVGTSGWLPLFNALGDAMEESKDVREVIREKLGLVLELEDGGSDGQVKTPVLLGHGKDDRIVNIELGKKLRDMLKRSGYEVTWNEYEDAMPYGHWFKDPEQYEDIIAFLKRTSRA